MDFMLGLSKSSEGYDSIWVIANRMAKSTHFLPIKTTDREKKLAKLYLKEIVRLHGVLVSIVSVEMLGSLQSYGKSYRRFLVHD